MRLQDKVAIITGGSRGIGFAIAKRFLEEGAEVIITASSDASAQKGAEKLQALFPDRRIKGIGPDLSSQASVNEYFDKVIEEFGHVDILVNNAGMADATTFTNYTDELFDKLMDLNLRGVYHASRAIVPHMIERKTGVILSTSSMVSFIGQAAGIAYPTSKAAVNGFTLSLARELAGKGIRVNAVAPGIIETDLMKTVPREKVQPLIDAIPLGRLGQPEDIANAFLFLASDEASYISGTILRVDGLSKN